MSKDDSEHCQACGKPYYHELGETWWRADDKLWLEIYGTTKGLRCPKCFTEGINVYYRAMTREDEECFFCIQNKEDRLAKKLLDNLR